MSTPHLKNPQAFKVALQHYRMNPEAKGVLAETPFAIMLAPTSAGRNTIIKELIKTGYYHFIISDTTRPPRINDGTLEQNGVEYFFRSEDEMLQEIREGRFVEAELIHQQQVSGTSIRELQKAHQEHKIALTDVDLGGSLTIAALKPDATLIFVVPPSFEEWLRRIVGRSNPAPQELRRRLTTAIDIFNTVLADDRYICVINDRLSDAVRQADQAIRLKQIDQLAQTQARQLIVQLLSQTKIYIATLI